MSVLASFLIFVLPTPLEDRNSVLEFISIPYHELTQHTTTFDT